MNNFPFPQQNPANQSGFSEDMSSETGFPAKPAKKLNPALYVNLVVNLAIPFPPGTEVNPINHDILARALEAEMALLGVEGLGLSIANVAIQIRIKLPSHLSADRLIRAIQSRIAYTLHLLTGKPLFFSGSAIVSTQDITADEISALTS